jgi:hypothetical protein
MSFTPLSTIFYGDVTLEKGYDPEQFGYGDLRVFNNVHIFGTTDSSSLGTTEGTLIVHDGGGYIGKSLFINRDLRVNEITYLNTTNINTDKGKTTIDGLNGVDISVKNKSNFCAEEDIVIKSSISNTYIEGNTGIFITTTLGNIDISSGTGGIYQISSGGNFKIISENGYSELKVNSYNEGQDLNLLLRGNTNSKINLESDGIADAIKLNTTHPNGKIILTNDTSGSIENYAGSGGFKVFTTIGNIILESGGLGNNAILIETNNNDGEIKIKQKDESLSAINIQSGKGGFNTTTWSGGSINMNAFGATSLYTNTTINDNENLTVSVTGNTDSKVIISSTGTGDKAIYLNSTGGSNSGIFLESQGPINIQSQSTINIGSNNNYNVPINIGTSNSVTTINGDLFIKGTTSEVNRQIVNIDDNIIVVNNSPYGLWDGGIAIKRWQAVNDLTGAVVNDTTEIIGTVGSFGSTLNTIDLGINASNEDDYYKGWWIKITSGNGQGQVRKIKAYNGTSKIATIYDSNDQTDPNVLNNVQPIEGLNWGTSLEPNSSTYALYPCHYVMSIWDESENEFAFVCSPNSPGVTAGQPIHYTNVRVNTLNATNVVSNNINGGAADTVINVNLPDNATIGNALELTNFPNYFGLYLLFIKPVNTNARASAIFMIGKRGDGGNGTNSPYGSIVRIISIKGINDEQLDLTWPNGTGNPKLYYRPMPSEASFPNNLTQYSIKIITL